MSALLKKAGLVFDENKVKPYLKMSITRLNLLVNTKANHIKISKKEIARLLKDGKEEKARIKVEQVIREDYTIEAYDILELHCELCAGRMRLLASKKEVPPDMEQAICTLIWAADRAEVPELSTVKAQFGKKYGQEYIKSAELNEDCCVNPKVIEKLDCQPPSGYAVTEYLLGIAEEYGVDYTPADPIRRKSSLDTEAAAIAALPAKTAYEAQSRRRPSGGGGAAGPPSGSGSGGGGGISSPPPVNAWVVPPSAGIPVATATLSPRNSYGGHADGVGGGGSGGVGASWDPNAAAAASHVPNHYVPGEAGKGYQQDPRRRDAPGRRSGGFEEATKGWAPSDVRGEDSPVAGKGQGGEDDAPPPYSPPRNATYDHTDIPSPPRVRPMAFDIPAAPGYEDTPKERNASGDGSSSAPAASGDIDDLRARFMNLRK